MVGIIGLTEILCTNREYLEGLGYQTAKVILLPNTGIQVPLGDNFFRDMGNDNASPDFMYGCALRMYNELGRPKEDVADVIDHLKGYPYGGFVLGQEVHVGKKVQVISKATRLNACEAIRDYVEAHEEAHVVDRLGESRLFDQWFNQKGVNHLDLRKITEREDREYLACAVGLVHTLSKGNSYRDINAKKTTSAEIHAEIHAEILPILERK